MVKISSRILALLVLTCLAGSAKDLPWMKPTSLTGRLTLDKDGVIRLSSGDIVVRSESRKYPVNNIPVDAIDASGRSARYDEAKKMAAEGKTVTLRGEFQRLSLRGSEAIQAQLTLFFRISKCCQRKQVAEKVNRPNRVVEPSAFPGFL